MKSNTGETRVEVIAALESILAEVGRIDNMLDAATDLVPEDRSVLKREFARLFEIADRLMTWTTEPEN